MSASRVLLPLFLFGYGLAPREPAPITQPAVSTERPAAELLARWQGGQLERNRFQVLYDPDGKALARGGDLLREAICKAVYRDIYQTRAIADGLDHNPEVVAELEAWRRARLARIYEFRHSTSTVSDEDIRAVYRRDLPQSYMIPATVSLDVLFVRCHAWSTETNACRAHQEDLTQRLEAGESLASLIAEEAARSGDANGHFDRVSVPRLDPTLARSVQSLRLGEISPPIETPWGWYRLRVTERHEATPAPFEAVAPAVRQVAEQEAHARWLESEIARQSRTTPGAPLAGSPNAEAMLVAAALAEGLATSPDFLAEESERRGWILADAAFLRHPEVHPSDAALAGQIVAHSRRFRHYRLVLATLSAAGERSTVLAAIARVRSALQGSAAPARRLSSLSSIVPGLEVESVGPVTAEQLHQRSPRLATLVEALEPGGWKGPEPISWRRLPVERLSAKPPQTLSADGLLFVAVEETWLPPLEEVRKQLLLAFRSQLGDGVEGFLAALGPLWRIELLAP